MYKPKVKDYDKLVVICPHCNQDVDVSNYARSWQAARAGKAGSREAKQRAAIERWSLNRKERKQAESIHAAIKPDLASHIDPIP